MPLTRLTNDAEPAGPGSTMLIPNSPILTA